MAQTPVQRALPPGHTEMVATILIRASLKSQDFFRVKFHTLINPFQYARGAMLGTPTTHRQPWQRPDRVRDRGGPGCHRHCRQPRPAGGNVTGLSSAAPDLVGKRIELLREVVPGVRRFAILANPCSPYVAVQVSEGRFVDEQAEL